MAGEPTPNGEPSRTSPRETVERELDRRIRERPGGRESEAARRLDGPPATPCYCSDLRANVSSRPTPAPPASRAERDDIRENVEPAALEWPRGWERMSIGTGPGMKASGQPPSPSGDEPPESEMMLGAIAGDSAARRKPPRRSKMGVKRRATTGACRCP